MLYAANTCTLTPTEEDQHLKCGYEEWKRLASLIVTNEEFLRRVNEDRQILNSLAKETVMDWQCFQT